MNYIGITGHSNIEKANNVSIEQNGNIYNQTIYIKVFNEIVNMIEHIMSDNGLSKNDIVLISGMARGVDEIMAHIAIKMDIPLIASIPVSINWHKNRKPSRGIKAQAIYYDKIINYINNRIKNGCQYSKIEEISKNYKNKQYQFVNFARNQNIVDNSDFMISYKKYESSGTNDTINRAIKANKYIGNITDDIFKKPFIIKYDKDIFNQRCHVLIHGCNCFNTMGKGIAKELKTRYPLLYKVDSQTKKGDRNKLGTFTFIETNDRYPKYIVNAYTQYTYWDKNDMFYIDAFEKSLDSIIDYFIKNIKLKNSDEKIKFALPPIGLGLANGNIEDIYNVLNRLSEKYIDNGISIYLTIRKEDIELKNEFIKLQQNNYNYLDINF